MFSHQNRDLADISNYNVPGSFVQAHWPSILGSKENPWYGILYHI